MLPVICGVLAFRGYVVPGRLPPNNVGVNLNFAGRRFLDRVTSHTSTENVASQSKGICDADPANLLPEPAPRSQGCEVARVLIGLDTSLRNKFPLGGMQKVK